LVAAKTKKVTFGGDGTSCANPDEQFRVTTRATTMPVTRENPGTRQGVAWDNVSAPPHVVDSVPEGQEATAAAIAAVDLVWATARTLQQVGGDVPRPPRDCKRPTEGTQDA